MILVTRDEMRAVDEAAQAKGIPAQILMENAGRAVADAAVQMLSRAGKGPKSRPAKGPTVVVLCGPGQNGGDGLAAARHLSARGYDVVVAIFGKRSSLPPEAGHCRLMLDPFEVPCFETDTLTAGQVLENLPSPDLIIDALLGTGSSGDPRSPIREAIEWANSAGCPILACDIPSGLDADTGTPGTPAIRASLTVAMGFAKVGLVTYPGRKFTGELVVANLGFPPSAFPPSWTGKTPEMDEARELMPKRDPDHHKGLSGHVCVVAGSVGMVGAACLAASSSLRAGAGTVTLVVPGGAYVPAASMVKEVMVVPAGDGPTFNVSSVAVVRRELERADAAVLGPGWGRGPDQTLFLQEILKNVAKLPCVVDADALAALKDLTGSLRRWKEEVKLSVLTPHPGEMARLLDVSTIEIQSSRVKWALQAAAECGAVVALKGAGTVTAHPQGKYVVNTSGHPAMATAGAGDVLSGMVGALLAQGLEPFDATWLGVYWHGLAGEVCAARVGRVGVLSGDIVRAIPRARRIIVEGR
ncbi:MAG TPA: NAD(P)H-hydrate dehydratase [Firmicutes bacterium]|nr:NAD(P)H-hydrate dehydratase [Candidatus Fermentithermobacillaceae bacterium]